MSTQYAFVIKTYTERSKVKTTQIIQNYNSIHKHSSHDFQKDYYILSLPLIPRVFLNSAPKLKSSIYMLARKFIPHIPSHTILILKLSSALHTRWTFSKTCARLELLILYDREVIILLEYVYRANTPGNHTILYMLAVYSFDNQALNIYFKLGFLFSLSLSLFWVLITHSRSEAYCVTNLHVPRKREWSL